MNTLHMRTSFLARHDAHIQTRFPIVTNPIVMLLAVIASGLAMTVEATAQNKVPFADREAVEAGKELFQREWVHQPPSLPEKGTMDDSTYTKLLKMLPGDGLGPMFNAKSCEACHTAGGGADVKRNVTLLTLVPRSPAITRLTRPRQLNANQQAEVTKQLEKTIDDLFPGFISPGGALSMDIVVHESSARAFYDPIRNQLNNGVTDGIAPEWFDRNKRTSQAIAARPVIAGRRGELDFYLSQRNSPPLFGLGLIDKIEYSRLLNIARVQSSRSAGEITGRLGDGKFGWRAQTRDLRSFILGACAGELGLQVPNTPQPSDTADMTYVSLGQDLEYSGVNQLVSYVQSLPAPIQQRGVAEKWAGVRTGKRLFAKIGCAACHVETVSPARGIYSDLLLHDMGELLQAPSPSSRGRLTNLSTMRIPRFPRENRPFGSGRSIASYYGGGSAIQAFTFARPAEPKFPYGRLPLAAVEINKSRSVTWDQMQREWRTPPLWGVADSAPYLHDGRATTLDAAIRWHDGEAKSSTTAYRTLEKREQELIVQFLKSLRSPATPQIPNELMLDKFQEPESQDLANTNTDLQDDDPLSIFNQAY